MRVYLFEEEKWLLQHLKIIHFHYLKCHNMKNQHKRNALSQMNY